MAKSKSTKSKTLKAKTTRQRGRAAAAQADDPTIKLWHQWLPQHMKAERARGEFDRIAARFPIGFHVALPDNHGHPLWGASGWVGDEATIDRMPLSAATQRRLKTRLRQMLAARERAGYHKAFAQWKALAKKSAVVADKLLSTRASSTAGGVAKLHVSAIKSEAHTHLFDPQTWLIDRTAVAICDELAPLLPADMRARVAKDAHKLASLSPGCWRGRSYPMANERNDKVDKTPRIVRVVPLRGAAADEKGGAS